MPEFVVGLLHLTWRGRISMAYYAVRRLAVKPAPTMERCVMGSVIGEHVWCPRRAPDDLWCRHHANELSGRTLSGAIRRGRSRTVGPDTT